MGFRIEDLDMADTWAIEDLMGQTMQEFVSGGSAKIPYVLAWRQRVHNGQPGLTFEEFQIENAHLSVVDVAAELGIGPEDEPEPEDGDEDPTNGDGPSPSPGSVTAGG